MSTASLMAQGPGLGSGHSRLMPLGFGERPPLGRSMLGCWHQCVQTLSQALVTGHSPQQPASWQAGLGQVARGSGGRGTADTRCPSRSRTCR